MRVDWRTSASLTGTVLKGLAAPLAVSAVVALLYAESPVPFLAPAAGTLVVGVALERLPRDDLYPREAFLMVSATWLAVALVGTVPFLLVGTGVFASPLDALFESMSGITTTGATVIGDFDAHPQGLLFWRQLLQWLGGLGILVLAVGLLSQLSVGGARLMETETRTEDVTKLAPRIGETARILGSLYVGLTVLLTVLLLALHYAGFAPNMGPFNAVSHALTTVATAGFSPEAESLGAFEPVVQYLVVLFMFLGATNFVLLYALTQGRAGPLRRSEEFRVYLGLVAATTAVAAVVLALDGTFPTVESTFRHALFQVVSILTTTGYASADFNVWSPALKHLLFLAMFVGGMAGSTTCSIKTVRWLVVLKSFRRELFVELHPEAVRPVRLGDEVVDESTVRDIHGYVLLGIVVFTLLTVLVVVDASRAGTGIGEFEAMGAAASTFLNIGPAFGDAGPYGSYAGFPAITKGSMVVLMWVGRIEIIPVLVLLTPDFWRS
ncbi:TrkH family potassium uptake protein [Halosegnis marinus]|uniref:TrkH family potassium uptake protein n=1 Tax=Halosegnis marinus TaxID=3034023 RepID=A0ABD5ZLN9_9EURY|nr:TrkH family potassium uptake protein [Halosegnis sp. DT85]